MDIEDQPQPMPFQEFHLIKEEMMNRRIKTRCVGGFEIFNTLLCGITLTLIDSTNE